MCNIWWNLFFATVISSFVDISDGECSMNYPCPLKGWSKYACTFEIITYGKPHSTCCMSFFSLKLAYHNFKLVL